MDRPPLGREGRVLMFKRMLGVHLMALKWENILQEVRLKAVLYNKWRDASIAREAGGGTSWPYDATSASGGGPAGVHGGVRKQPTALPNNK